MVRMAVPVGVLVESSVPHPATRTTAAEISAGPTRIGARLSAHPPRSAAPRAARTTSVVVMAAPDAQSVDLKPRSHDVTTGFQKAPARAMLRAVGMTDDDWDKPQ